MCILLQRFIPDTKVFENGVFLGPLAHLTFAGPFATKDRQLTFDVTSMNVGLGPWKFSIPLKKGVTSMEDVPERYETGTLACSQKQAPTYWYCSYTAQDMYSFINAKTPGAGCAGLQPQHVSTFY